MLSTVVHLSPRWQCYFFTMAIKYVFHFKFQQKDVEKPETGAVICKHLFVKGHLMSKV